MRHSVPYLSIHSLWKWITAEEILLPSSPEKLHTYHPIPMTSECWNKPYFLPVSSLSDFSNSNPWSLLRMTLSSSFQEVPPTRCLFLLSLLDWSFLELSLIIFRKWSLIVVADDENESQGMCLCLESWIDEIEFRTSSTTKVDQRIKVGIGRERKRELRESDEGVEGRNFLKMIFFPLFSPTSFSLIINSQDDFPFPLSPFHNALSLSLSFPFVSHSFIILKKLLDMKCSFVSTTNLQQISKTSKRVIFHSVAKKCWNSLENSNDDHSTFHSAGHTILYSSSSSLSSSSYALSCQQN